MKILFLSNLYPPNVVGGYERLCFEVASAFAARGHTVNVLTSTYGREVCDYQGQTVYRELTLLADRDNIYTPFAASEQEIIEIRQANAACVRRVVAETVPDKIFAWNLFFLDRSFLDAIADDACRIVLMLTDNWLIAMQRPDFLGPFFRNHVFGDEPFPPAAAASTARARQGLLSRLLRGFHRDATAAPSMPFSAVFGARFVRDLYSAAGLDFARDAVIHNGVRQAVRPAGDFVDRSGLVNPGELRLLFAGRLVDLKGVHTAVEALATLNRAALPVPRIRLTIVGDGQDLAYVQRLEDTIDQSGCRAQIECLPSVAEDALFALFQTHDIYIFPSYYEPFSLTLIHALAAGIPTVATRVGGNVEIITDRQSGCLFEKGDAADLARAVGDLVRDVALRVSVARSAREASRQFTFESMVDRMEQFLGAVR